MTKPVRIALYAWLAVTMLIVLGLVWTYSRHGPAGFETFIQQAPYTYIPITHASVAIGWLLAGFFLWLLDNRRITRENLLTWLGFFAVAFLYLNVLRERHRYGDISYYTDAALSLFKGQPLPDTYLYPPLWATLLEFLVPYGEENILIAAWLLNVASLFLFYFLVHKTLQRYGFAPQLAALVTTIFLLVNMPMLRTLFYVQVNIHVMNLVLLGLLLFRDRPFLSSLAFAFAIHLKASPAVLVLAFLLEHRWRWIAYLSVNILLIMAFTVVMNGMVPYFDFVRNFLLLNDPRVLSFHDSSFDSFIGATLSFFRVEFTTVRVIVYLAKAVSALAVLLVLARNRRQQTFLRTTNDQAHGIFNLLPSLFILMTLAAPLIWEHHGLFLSLTFLVLLKRLETPSEWIWFGAAYLLEYLLPTFDYFPWSYGRLVAPLIVLWLMWKAAAHEQEGRWFILANNFDLLNAKAQRS